MATIEATSAVSGYRQGFARKRKKENVRIYGAGFNTMVNVPYKNVIQFLN